MTEHGPSPGKPPVPGRSTLSSVPNPTQHPNCQTTRQNCVWPDCHCPALPEPRDRISASEGTPQTVIACWIGAWSGDTEDDRENALALRSAAIDHAFNPPDADSDQGSILESAVLRAGAYIESQPCTCTDDEPCPRCHALNRWHDVPMER